MTTGEKRAFLSANQIVLLKIARTCQTGHLSGRGLAAYWSTTVLAMVTAIKCPTTATVGVNSQPWPSCRRRSIPHRHRPACHGCAGERLEGRHERPGCEALLGEEYALQAGLRDNIRSLESELNFMHSFLQDCESLQAISAHVKGWAREVQELDRV